jgi:hypothetical protein
LASAVALCISSILSLAAIAAVTESAVLFIIGGLLLLQEIINTANPIKTSSLFIFVYLGFEMSKGK